MKERAHLADSHYESSHAHALGTVVKRPIEHPMASPLSADLRGCRRLLIMVGTTRSVCDDFHAVRAKPRQSVECPLDIGGDGVSLAVLCRFLPRSAGHRQDWRTTKSARSMTANGGARYLRVTQPKRAPHTSDQVPI